MAFIIKAFFSKKSDYLHYHEKIKLSKINCLLPERNCLQNLPEKNIQPSDIL